MDIHHLIVVHSFIHDVFLQGLLVQMYGKCGSLDHALNVFNAMPEHSLFSWNVIIRASAQQGQFEMALKLFYQMQREGTIPDRFTYVCALVACTGKGDIWYGMQMHAQFIGSSMEFDISIGTAVVKMYGNYRKVHDAKQSFEKMREHDVVSWNVMLGVCAQIQHSKDVLQFFCHMLQQGHLPTSVSFLTMLDACAMQLLLNEGKRIHVYLSSGRIGEDNMVENALVNMYGRCCLRNATIVFHTVHVQNVVTWTTMISCCVQHGENELAFQLFGQMSQEGVLPDRVTFLEILGACVGSEWLSNGERLAACLSGIADEMVMTEIVNMYGRCGSIDNAQKIFDTIRSQSTVAWNTLISVYLEYGEVDEVFQLFGQFLLRAEIPSSVTFIIMLSACMKLRYGRMLHAFIVENNYELETTMNNAIISMYSKNANIEDAWSTFNNMELKDVISWNALISAYAAQGQLIEACGLLEQMMREGIKPNKVTYAILLEGYAHCEMSTCDDQLDGSNIYWERQHLGSTLISELNKSSLLLDSQRLFYEMEEKDVRAWNAMINIHAHLNDETGPPFVFSRMLEEACLPSNDTLISIISACSGETRLSLGKRIHSCVTSSECENDFALGTALVKMYGSIGNTDEARKAFETFTNKNVVLWTAMIYVYVQCWQGDEGLKLFMHMQQCGVLPNKVTYMSVLEACITQGIFNEGRNVHACISCGDFLSDIPVVTALIEMYSKCGKLDDAWKIFCDASRCDNFLWNTMLTLYSQHGHASEALELFRLMEGEKLEPDKVSFISVLTACSHGGLLKDGFYWLANLLQHYVLLASSAHYVCMIDTVGRAGQLDVAQTLVNGMPFQPTEVPYIMLLRACQQGADLKHGAWAAAHAFELFSGNTAPYVLLSNIYSAKRSPNFLSTS
ncbi:hypothetical protein KP509_30G066200 [Ceratopteris richardii]|nr:hypothetical protein KP509_30G066200 [Ceratopteris richardii]